jgi:alpha-L-arabinofuranosidase
MEVEVHIDDVDFVSLVDGEVLTAAGPDAENTLENPDRVAAVNFQDTRVDGRRLTVEMPPFSYVAATIRISW